MNKEALTKDSIGKIFTIVSPPYEGEKILYINGDNYNLYDKNIFNQVLGELSNSVAYAVIGIAFSKTKTNMLFKVYDIDSSHTWELLFDLITNQFYFGKVSIKIYGLLLSTRILFDADKIFESYNLEVSSIIEGPISISKYNECY